jgi:hypothetical protein
VEPDVRPVETPPNAAETASEIASATTGERDTKYVLELSAGQFQDLVQQEAASRGGGRGLLWAILALNGVGERINMDELARDERYQNGRISRSTIISLVVLGAFASGEEHGVKRLADELSISVATTWRYVNTWVVDGVLEEHKNRRYQLARRWQCELSKHQCRGTSGTTDRGLSRDA